MQLPEVTISYENPKNYDALTDNQTILTDKKSLFIVKHYWASLQEIRCVDIHTGRSKDISPKQNPLKTMIFTCGELTDTLTRKGFYGDLAEVNIPSTSVYNPIPEITTAILDYWKEKNGYNIYQKTVQQGKNMSPTTHILNDEEIELNPQGSTIQEQYTSIVGEISQLTSTINEQTALANNKEIADAFLSAKSEIAKLASPAVSKTKGFLNKYLENTSFWSKIKDTAAEYSSIQDNINYLFGTIHEKYETLLSVGESLQASKNLMVAQIDSLQKLAITSDEELSKYEEVDRPIRDIALNTQIKASIEKYKNRLLKIDGALMGVQTTIISLGKELPAMKTDLTDEMAISSLLSSVDDYQKMFAEVATLVSDVATSTADQTHHVISNLLDMQIKDTHTTDYLAKSVKRGEDYATMITDKSKKLAAKINRDAAFIADIAKGNTIEHARKHIKLLE